MYFLSQGHAPNFALNMHCLVLYTQHTDSMLRTFVSGAFQVVLS